MGLPVPLIVAAAELLPSVFRVFKGNKQADVAEQVVRAAKIMTGNDDGMKALEIVKADPQLLVQLEAQAKDIAVAEMQAQTAQLQSVNETMRAELENSSLFKSGWRPAFGWCMTVLFSLFILVVLVLPAVFIVLHPGKAASIIRMAIEAIDGMMWIWVAAFSVLGVNIRQRSVDKQVKAGVQPAGLLSFLNRR